MVVFNEYHSGQLPAGGEGQQLHSRLRALRCRQAGEVDQDETSNQGLSFTQIKTSKSVSDKEQKIYLPGHTKLHLSNVHLLIQNFSD